MDAIHPRSVLVAAHEDIKKRQMGLSQMLHSKSSCSATRASSVQPVPLVSSACCSEHSTQEKGSVIF